MVISYLEMQRLAAVVVVTDRTAQVKLHRHVAAAQQLVERTVCRRIELRMRVYQHLLRQQVIDREQTLFIFVRILPCALDRVLLRLVQMVPPVQPVRIALLVVDD